MTNRNLRKHLEKLTRPELEKLSERVLGKSNNDLRSKTLIIYELEAKPDKVYSVIGLRTQKKRPNTEHLYGIIGIIIGLLGLSFTIFQLYSTSLKSSFTQPNIDIFTKKQIEKKVLQAGLTPTPSPLLAKQTQSLNEVSTNKAPLPSTDGFLIVNQEIVLDLRSYRPLDQASRYKFSSPVTRHTQFRVRKTKANADKLVWRASTSGYALFVEIPTHPNKFRVYHENIVEPSGSRFTKPSFIEVDVADVPVGSEFIITTKLTYWNAFQDKESWAGVRTYLPTEKLSFLFLFPNENKPKDIRIKKTDQGRNEIDIGVSDEVLFGENNQFAWWRIAEPAQGYGHNVEWDWKFKSQ